MKKILIVDDEPLIVKGLQFALEQDGYAVEAAYDGEEALNIFLNDIYGHPACRYQTIAL